MRNKKILFLIPDGVGIRNYLYSDVLKYLKQEADIVFWSPLPEKAFDEVKVSHDINIKYQNIKLLPESLFSRLFREAATYARLKYNSAKIKNLTILNNWRKEKKNFKLRQLYTVAEKIGSWSSKKYDRILSLEQKSKKYWNRSVIDQYKKDLRLLNPTSVFIPHQRVAGLMPVCLAAKELNIPVISAIYSWDNLPKARLAVQADKYIAWSDYMKEEMRIYYPEIPQENVIVTGTPQFEFYSQPKRIISRKDFADKYGLDINKQWICYSGDDVLTSPYDQDYLKDIAESLIDNNEIQILFRRCPVDFSERYDTVLNKYRNLIVSVNPEWHTTKLGWVSFFPKISDVDLLVNVTYHCDLVINVGSTMAHDFAVFDKPCLYINYDQKHSQNWSVKTIYNYQHFRSMDNLDAVGWLTSKEEITNKINQALQNPKTIGKDRRKWLNKIIQHPLEENSKKIAQVLLNK